MTKDEFIDYYNTHKSLYYGELGVRVLSNKRVYIESEGECIEDGEVFFVYPDGDDIIIVVHGVIEVYLDDLSEEDQNSILIDIKSTIYK